MRKQVKVTALDIRRGEPNNSASCPIARAVARTFHKKVGTFDVYHSHVEKSDNYSWSAKIPSEAGDFITKFDEEEKVKPFTFTLEY